MRRGSFWGTDASKGEPPLAWLADPSAQKQHRVLSYCTDLVTSANSCSGVGLRRAACACDTIDKGSKIASAARQVAAGEPTLPRAQPNIHPTATDQSNYPRRTLAARTSSAVGGPPTGGAVAPVGRLRPAATAASGTLSRTMQLHGSSG
jgi:hypothetical protein